MKKTVKILISIWVVFLVVVLVVNLFNRTMKIEMIQHGEMEKSYSFEAMIIRDETVMSAEKSGVLETMVKDNEMVRKNKHVASIFETKVDSDTKAKLANVNLRIEEITKLKEESANVVSKGFMIESAIDDKIFELMDAMEEGSMEKAVSARDDINILIDKKVIWEKGTEYTDKMLEDLLEEKESYEKKLGNAKQDLFSPVAGIYSTNIDGYEEILTLDAIGTMTPEDFNSIKNMDISKEDIKKKGYPCKIIDNFTWAVAFVATEEEISKLDVGSSVYIRNTNSPGDLKATIAYISTPSKGKFVVIATSNVSCEWATKDRFVNIDLVKAKYSGLKVPIKALHVKDGITGSYVVVDGIVKFKKTKIVYKDSLYAIIEENNLSQDGLLLYDEVIVSSPRKLKVGDKIS